MILSVEVVHAQVAGPVTVRTNEVVAEIELSSAATPLTVTVKAPRLFVQLFVYQFTVELLVRTETELVVGLSVEITS